MATNKPINSVFIFKAGTSEKIKKESKSKKSLETIMKQAEYFDRHVGKRWNYYCKEKNMYLALE